MHDCSHEWCGEKDGHCWGFVSKELLEAQRSEGICQQVSENLAGIAADTGNSGGRDDGMSTRISWARTVSYCDTSQKLMSPSRLVPCKLRKSFLRYHHNSALVGRLSGRKSYSKVSHVATWPHTKNDVLQRSRSCLAYRVAKPRGGKPPSLIQPVTCPLQIAACVVMGPYLRNPHGNQRLCIIIDHFSKWVELISHRKLVSKRI